MKAEFLLLGIIGGDLLEGNLKEIDTRLQRFNQNINLFGNKFNKS